MKRKKTYSLLVLAGGKSSRMGQNKAELVYDGKTFLETLIAKGKHLGFEEIYVSGYFEDLEDVCVVKDIYKDRGPLSGIHACMKQMKTPFCMVLPVDVPQIPLDVLEGLLCFHQERNCPCSPVLLEHDGRRENLIGIYPVEIADLIEKIICKKSASVYQILEIRGFLCYNVENLSWQVENMNTKEVYQKVLSHRLCEIGK